MQIVDITKPYELFVRFVHRKENLMIYDMIWKDVLSEHVHIT